MCYYWFHFALAPNVLHVSPLTAPYTKSALSSLQKLYLFSSSSTISDLTLENLLCSTCWAILRKSKRFPFASFWCVKGNPVLFWPGQPLIFAPARIHLAKTEADWLQVAIQEKFSSQARHTGRWMIPAGKGPLLTLAEYHVVPILPM